MRIAIVSSEVNYVKDNYQHLITELIREHKDAIVGLVIVRTLSAALVLKSLGLYLIGARGISKNILRNAWNSLFKSPESFFEAKGIPVFKTKSINSLESQDFLRSLQLDLILNLRTRNIFKKDILEIPRWGCINIHHGLLPQYRGTMCDLWALSEGRAIGYSIHWMNQKIDDGRLLRVRELKELDTKNYSEIPYLSSLQEAKDLKELLDKFKNSGPEAGSENRGVKVLHSKNPTRHQIREMIEKGIEL